jgi:hypothetical protein
MRQTEDLANNFRVPTLRESRRLHIDTVDLNDASTLIRGFFDGKTLCQGKGKSTMREKMSQIRYPQASRRLPGLRLLIGRREVRAGIIKRCMSRCPVSAG